MSFGCDERNHSDQDNELDSNLTQATLDHSDQNVEASKNLVPAPLHKRLSSGWSSLALDTWLFEIIAICFSVACFIAIFCILWVYDQTPTPKFSHGLTLNTIVSVLATASKSSLIFVVGQSIGQLRWIWFQKGPKPLSHLQDYDSASRGPWGSCFILFQDKGRSLVSIGALITILALVFDPFVQQILTYPVRQTSRDSSSATAKQSHFILPGDGNMDFMDAINSAFWSNDFAVNPTCASGNCSWPLFQSVELCSKCEDVTSSATLIGCDNVPFNASLNEDQSGPCNISLPQGDSSSEPVSIIPHFGDSFDMYIPEDIIWDVHRLKTIVDPDVSHSSYLSTSSDIPYVVVNKTFIGVKNPLLVVAHAALTLPSGKTSKLQSHPEKGLKIRNVTQCVLSLCARTYNVSVSDGIPSTSISAPDYGTFVPFKDPEGKSPGNVCWHPGTGTSVNVASKSDGQYTNTTEFAFCPATLFDDYDLQLTGSKQRNFWWTNSGGPDYAFWRNYQRRNNPEASSQNVQKIVASGLEKVTHNMAASLGKFARSTSNGMVTGSMAISESYVDVNWPWLTLPALLLVLGIVFLVSTLLANKQRKLSLWRNSVLPILYHGLERDLVEAGDEYAPVSEMERTAGAIDVKLGFSDTQSRLMLRR
ncbi:hypothetical protein N7537_010350 [Penicillium hordei]|uniref:Uncharacterized protein n=1 Tax=Penicillium hordei TaxID=40994 RepID=A0AAD6GVL0_9EURO|nr:uncharacterized protein N7537_010350 [Penicillium hordei]KAJ5593446.1 hypothetical protein N7537_010350 [Penicillium hordei]